MTEQRTDDVPMTFMWDGKWAEEMSRDELYEAIHYLIGEKERLENANHEIRINSMRDLAAQGMANLGRRPRLATQVASLPEAGSRPWWKRLLGSRKAARA